MKWWEKPLVISAVQCNYGEDSFETLEKQVVGRHFNTEQLLHLTASGHMGYYEEKKDGDKLDAYLKESRKNGIREIFYYNVHCITQPMYDGNPAWSQLDRDGKPIKAYEVFYLNCINSSWIEYFSDNFAKLCTHDIDGVFLDGPVVSQSGCYCPACQKKFSAAYGKSLFDATASERLAFNVDSVTTFMRKTREVLNAQKPELLLYINNSALRADVTGSNTRQVEPYVDMLGAEGGFIWVNKNTPLWHVSPMAKVIETQAKGKPTVIFIAGDYKPYSYYMHTAQETKLYYAQSVANGANVWYGIHGQIPQMHTPGGQAAEAFNKFIRDNADIYTKTGPASRIALMWSQNSANHYASSVATTDFTNAADVGADSEKKGNHYDSFMGFYEILMRNHVQHDIIDEVNLVDGSLDRYDLLILPTCACLSDAEAQSIRAFVKKGGNLISSFDTGFYDEIGQRVSAPKLGDVQGIGAVEGFCEYKLYGTGYQKEVSPSELGEGLSWKLTPSPSLAYRVRPADGARVLFDYTEPMIGRYVALPAGTYPGVIENRCGQGRSIYFTGAEGEYFSQYTNPDHKIMVANAVKAMADPLVETNAPGSVEVVLRRQEGRYVLHVINMTGEMERPIQRIIPLPDVQFTLHLDGPVRAVRSVTGQSPADFAATEKGCTFTVPCVNDYEVLIIE